MVNLRRIRICCEIVLPAIIGVLTVGITGFASSSSGHHFFTFSLFLTVLRHFCTACTFFHFSSLFNVKI